MVCFVQALIFSRSVFTYGAVNSDADGKITGSVLFCAGVFESMPAEHTLLFHLISVCDQGLSAIDIPVL